MTDKLIEQIKVAQTGAPMWHLDYVRNMEARILADAKIIKAAEELADAVDGDSAMTLLKALAAYRAAVSERDA